MYRNFNFSSLPLRIEEGVKEVDSIKSVLENELPSGNKDFLITILVQIRNAFGAVNLRIGSDEMRAKNDACEAAEELLKNFKKRPTVAKILESVKTTDDFNPEKPVSNP